MLVLGLVWFLAAAVPGTVPAVITGPEGGSSEAPSEAPAHTPRKGIMIPSEPLFDPAAAAPYFTDKERSEAVQELMAGHGAAALRLLPKSPKDVQTRFVRAQALAASGDMAAAAVEFEALSSQYTVLSIRCHCLAAAAFEGIGDLDHAAPHWRACSQDPTHARTALLAAGRILQKLDKRADALDALKPLIANPGYGRADALVQSGVILDAWGQTKAAVEDYAKAYLEEPLSPASDRARDALKEDARKLKQPPVSTAQRLERIDRLLTGKQVIRAERELAELRIKPLCVGEQCKPKRCHETGATEAETEKADTQLDATPADADTDAADEVVPPVLVSPRKAHSFHLAKAKDDEEAPGTSPDMPACMVSAPSRPADPIVCKTELLKGWADSHTRGLRVRALNALRAVYARCGDPDVRARALFYAQGIAARVGDNDALDLALIDALQFPSNALADDALMAAADLARNDGDGRTERRALRRLVRVYPESDQRAEALFRLYWSHRADGRPDRGLQYLDTLSTDYENGPHGDGGDAERGRYWWGRSVYANAVKADRPKGLDVLTKLARERPTTYYGLLARSFISSVEPSHLVTPVAVTPYPGLLRLGLLGHDRAFPAALELWRLGDLKDARELLLAVDFKALKDDGVRGQESALIVAELLRDMGDARMAHAIARRELLGIIREGTDPLGRRAAMVCYPLAFRDSVSEHAAEAGFPPDFLQGLMREESALDPLARSPVGALGLTQVMPATARQVAKSLGLRGFATSALWKPDVNIRIGSYYLGKMLKQFGHPGLAAAAYNAGPNAVSRWLTGAKGAFDEFVEQIPFQETKGYVKRVLRSYAAYSYLYEPPKEKALRVSLMLPAITGTK
jgi:soluble lytic murein transglycosylase-like protein